MHTTTGLHDRIYAMFALSAIGDALGAPVEMMSAEAISGRYGRLTQFVERTEHKFGPIAKGETTDDTQLALAIARSVARKGAIDLDDVAREHVLEMKKMTRGWGGSTRDAVARLSDGVHRSASGSVPEREGGKRGKGNGVAMKIHPVGAYCALRDHDPLIAGETRNAIRDLALMTHGTGMGVASGLAQVAAIRHLLLSRAVLPDRFALEVAHAAYLGERVFPCVGDEDLLSDRFLALRDVTRATADDMLRSQFGGGACYVYESLPLAYALFLRKPHSIEALYDAVNFGGDTDTVAAIVGALSGAYNGSGIIPWELWADVDRRDEIDAVVDALIRTLL